jgi:hypothetical protein
MKDGKMDILGKLKDWLTLGVVPLSGVAIASAVVLFAPSQFIHTVGLDQLISVAQPYVGGAFVLSSSVLISMAGKTVWDAVVRSPLKQALEIRVLRKELMALTDDEKEVLARFINGRTRSQNLSIQDAVVLGLQQRRILIRIGNVGLPGYGMMFPYQIQPWAWEHLNRYKDLLERSN